GASLVFGVVLLLTNPLHGLVRWHESAGLVITLDTLEPALRVMGHLLTLLGLVGFAVLCAVVERRTRSAPEFPVGMFLGVASVLLTVLLTGVVLLADGAERWSTFVKAVFVLHIPIALLEGVILGFTLAFLARVKPEMLFARREEKPTPGDPPLSLSVS